MMLVRSTRPLLTLPPYLGVDLTDRYAKGRRPVDVCGLVSKDSRTFQALFWQWTWNGDGPLDVSPLLDEVQAARVTMVDGPLGLAAPGQRLRACERTTAAVGKTPDHRPVRGPFAGYIGTSLDVFDSLARHGIPIDREGGTHGGAYECYPGHAWMCLATGLVKKSSQLGRIQRRALLQHLGIAFDGNRVLTHDQLDACLAALLAAAWDGAACFGVTTTATAAAWQDTTHVLREGRMVYPALDDDLKRALTQVASVLQTYRPTPVLPRRSRRSAKAPDPTRLARAEALCDTLVQDALRGAPRLVTYQAAYRILFNKTPATWSQDNGDQVSWLAKATQPRPVCGVGSGLRLDAFLVNKKTKRPGVGHWNTVNYDQEEWLRAFGDATVEP